MEKIQAALAKARAHRGGAQSPGKGTTSNVVSSARPGSLGEGRSGSSAAERLAARRMAIAQRWSDLSPTTFQPGVMERSRLSAFRGGAEATHFNVLRTRILQQMAENGWKRLAITSPGPGCGKTTLSLNLGFSLARLPDLRTMICEVDLRRPAMQKMLNQNRDHSFAEVLSGGAHLADHTMRFGSNLGIATNRSSVHSPSELMQGDAVPVVLDRIQAEYDPSVWIFDLPPMLVSDDALAFADRVDCAIIMAGAEVTTLKQIDKCERDLATRTNVIGIILNKCRYMDREDTFDYSYDYK
jgi:protein-tyrosine kinase